MVGTEKQVEWAEKIRAGIKSGFERSIEWNDIRHPLIDCYIERVNEELTNDSAVYWINMRGSDRSIKDFMENLWTQAWNISEAVSDEIVEMMEDNQITEAMDIFWEAVKELPKEKQLEIFTVSRNAPIDYEK